uniref:G protein-coupled receptor 149 n=1 Tax=Petromyzon marinus TaxID=7757 RepID=S4RX36_PETMA
KTMSQSACRSALPSAGGSDSNSTAAADPRGAAHGVSLLFFSATLLLVAAVLAGSLYSVSRLLQMPRRGVLEALVLCLCVDELLGALPAALFLYVHASGGDVSPAVCALSGFLYEFVCLAGALKAAAIVLHNASSLSSSLSSPPKARSSPARRKALWTVLCTWGVSLLLSVLPLCGWDRFEPRTWGCFLPDSSSHGLFVCVLFVALLCALTALSLPALYKLFCRPGERTLSLSATSNYYTRMVEGKAAAAAAAAATAGARSTGPAAATTDSSSKDASNSVLINNAAACARTPYVGMAVAQKRFALLITFAKLFLWLPMMIHLALQFSTGRPSPSSEELSFILSLFAMLLSPLLILSRKWLHLPCGCIINCHRNTYAMNQEIDKGQSVALGIDLSFHKGYEMYRADHISPKKYFFNNDKVNILPNQSAKDSEKTAAPHRSQPARVEVAPVPKSQAVNAEASPPRYAQPCDFRDEVSAMFGGQTQKRFGGREGRRSESGADGLHGDRTTRSGLYLHDGLHSDGLEWEWCRSKSERTPRQRLGGLSTPLCAIQGTVSLQSPTGKTLSLSTYEISGDGKQALPVPRKVEVYRSKSVGHQPSSEGGCGGGGGGGGGGLGDTNVKIHLEVLEICDNGDKMDTVSIVSNISQSSTRARSPSLRYSRKENRFVSVDLDESASYSLFIPSNSPESDINITIPDTVEAHRQNSRKERPDDGGGYKEEIQLLNQVYREREKGDAAT